MADPQKVPTPSQRLQDAANLFRQRNDQYGNNYQTIGAALHQAFGGKPTVVSTPEEWYRVFTVCMLVMKTTRYAQNLHRGGHQDSLDDLSVYAQMGAEMDDIARIRGVTKNYGAPRPEAPAAGGVASDREVRSYMVGDLEVCVGGPRDRSSVLNIYDKNHKLLESVVFSSKASAAPADPADPAEASTPDEWRR